MAIANLHIRLFGSGEIIRNSQPVDLPPSRKARALLFYLVSTAQSHSRKHLCDLLWDGVSDPRAALRWGLSKIRPAVDDLNTKRIVTIGNKLKFNPENVDVDYYFLKDLQKHDLSEVPDNLLQHAAELCRGPFLEDCEAPGCYLFETWLITQRESTKNLQYNILSTWIDRLKTDPEKAIVYARKLLLLNPYQEKAYIRLIELLGKVGYTNEALQVYNQCRDMLRTELDASPSLNLEAARKKLIQINKSSTPGKSNEKELLQPFVGRREERESMVQLISDAEQENLSKLLLITGEPGIGKTRLLRELTECIKKVEGSSLYSRAYSLEISRPYAPWTDLLQSLQQNMIPGSVKKGISPLLADSGSPAMAEGNQNRLFNGVVELIRILGSDGKPLALLFDNLQWFDDPSITLLSFVFRKITGSNIIIACTARTAELKENLSATQFVYDLRRKTQIREIELPPLSQSEVKTLVQTVNPKSDSQRIHQKSNGNPLFALELAFAFKKNDDSLPNSLKNLIQERFHLLDHQTKNVLDWMAVYAQEVDLDILSHSMDYSASHLLEAVEELEHYNIIRAEPGDRYNFVHELVQNAAYQLLSAPKKKMIHRCIAKTMAENQHFTKKHAVEIIHHAEIGEEDELISKYCLTAGRRALEVFAHKQVAEFVEKGLNHLGSLADGKRIVLQIELLCLYVNSGMISFQPPDLIKQLRNCIGQARQAGLNEMVQKALDGISHFYYLKGDYHLALDRMMRAEEAGRASDPVTMVKAIADTAKCYGMIEQNIDRAEELALEANKFAAEFDLENKIYDIPLALAFVNHYKGNYTDAIHQYETAIQIIKQEEKDRWWEYLTIHRLTMLYLDQGHALEALQLSRKLIPITKKMGSESEEPFSRALKSMAQYMMNEKNAVQRLDSQLKILRALDSQWMIAWLQCCAARQDLDFGQPASAKKRAEEAVKAASLVNRRNEKALGISILIRLFAEEGKLHRARELLKSSKEEFSDTQLSHFARQSLEKITQILT